MGKSTIIFSVGIVLFVLLVWGLIGSSQSAEMGITCDIGIGDDGSVFCWKWHQNIIGEMEDTIEEIFNE